MPERLNEMDIISPLEAQGTILNCLIELQVEKYDQEKGYPSVSIEDICTYLITRPSNARYRRFLRYTAFKFGTDIEILRSKIEENLTALGALITKIDNKYSAPYSAIRRQWYHTDPN